jgi:hypothetical protein
MGENCGFDWGWRNWGKCMGLMSGERDGSEMIYFVSGNFAKWYNNNCVTSTFNRI